ncbi:MAG: PEP-CTERM sorting domain-containing protein [Rubrivivax sp.]|nr:MAG: PEP-CTERM sorting domain-containing protein [Rubrivivax sp.]
MQFADRLSLAPQRPSFAKLLGASVMLIAAMAGAPAQAATVTVSYSGVVGFGFDTTGMFGVAGASYNYQPYTLVYTIDDQAFGAVAAGTPTMSQITGQGAGSPVHAALTVNGVTRTINGSLEGTAQQYDLIHASGQAYGGVGDKVRQVSNEYSYVVGGLYHSYSAETYVFSYDQDFVQSPDYHAPLTYPGNRSTDSIYSLVQFNDYDFATGKQLNYAYFNLNIGRAVVTSSVVPAVVPEPESLGLLLAGLLTLGGLSAARRRRTARPS